MMLGDNVTQGHVILPKDIKLFSEDTKKKKKKKSPSQDNTLLHADNSFSQAVFMSDVDTSFLKIFLWWEREISGN